jgi:hypothetical protein
MSRLMLALVVLIALPLGLSASRAGLLQPQTIDANTGSDAIDVGASFAPPEAWAAFEQATAGVNHVYYAHATGGVFGQAQRVDVDGSATSAAFLGSGAVTGPMLVFTEQVGGVSKLFGQRLANGSPLLQISVDTQNVRLLRVHRVRQVAQNSVGDAAVCYVDNNTGQVFAAVLASHASAWTRFGPLTNTECDDIAVDRAGDTIVLGIDGNNRATTDRIVGGVLQPGEEVDPTAKDEPALAVSGNSALVLARIELPTGPFDADAWKMANIAAGGYTALGSVSGALLDPNGNYNVEFAKAALAANGKGIVTFRLGNPGTQTSLDYLRTVDLGSGVFGQPVKLAGESLLTDVTPAVDGQGNGLALWGDQNGATEEQHVRSFAPGAPSQDVILPDASQNGETSFVADDAGDFLAAVERGSSPVRVAAFFADFAPPTMQPASLTPHPRAAGIVKLQAAATDTFAGALTVQWQFPAHSIVGSNTVTGDEVSVRLATVGTIVAHVTATDEGGNVANGQVALLATALARLHARPATARTRARVRFSGSGFAPGKAVTLTFGPGGKHLKRLGSAHPGATGVFSVRLRVRGLSGRYVVRACQLGCRIKATAGLRVR